jgi:alkylation response protein AidB-like acyl-CoA dehydrogenase
MDLTYPPEAEAFRTVVRDWLADNLPDGWFDEGFEMSADERVEFNETWPQKMIEGGWYCATWPAELGGRGLSTMEAVVMNEEFHAAGAPQRGDFFGDTLVGPTILQWGTDEQKGVHPEDPARRGRLVSGLLRTRRRQRPGGAQDNCGARRRRMGASTARRSGPPRASTPTTSSSSAAPIPRPASTRASRICCAR